MLLLLLMLAACNAPPSDADLYRRALVTSTASEQAAARCRQIADVGLAGDCQVAVMERFETLEAGSCAEIRSDLWRDECVFLLAERQWRAGQQLEGLSTCRQTRFARACTWHLIQDEAESAAAQSAAEAQARLEPFRASNVAPDAAMHFWKLWLRARLAAGIAIDEKECATIEDVRSCREAVGRTIHELLEASGRTSRAELCAAPAGQRVVMNGAPAWRPGELSTAAEKQWVERHCPSLTEASR